MKQLTALLKIKGIPFESVLSYIIVRKKAISKRLLRELTQLGIAVFELDNHLTLRK